MGLADELMLSTLAKTNFWSFNTTTTSFHETHNDDDDDDNCDNDTDFLNQRFNTVGHRSEVYITTTTTMTTLGNNNESK